MEQSYSYSKRESLENCARRYFYQYYAAAKGVPFDAERKLLVRVMKTLTNRHMLAGKVLHDLIQMRLKSGMAWSPVWFMNQAASRFDAVVLVSKQVVDSGNPASKHAILSEIAYGDIDADTLLDDTRNRLLSSLNTFLTHPDVRAAYEPILANPFEVESKVKDLRIADYAIDGKVDLLGRSSQGIDILDWKMGSSDASDDSLQLFIYGWWLGAKYSVPPQQIRARKIFLTGPTVGQSVALDGAMMRRGKARIVQDIELMQELDPYGRQGKEEAFTPCGHPNVCRQCSFRGVCSAGSSTIKLKQTSTSLPLLQALS